MKTNDYTVRLFYRVDRNGDVCDFLTEKHFATADAARDFRVTALRTIAQWTPRGSFDAEVSEIAGPDLALDRPSREAFLRGIAAVRRSLDQASGPLAADLARAAHVTKPDAERVAS